MYKFFTFEVSFYESTRASIAEPFPLQRVGAQDRWGRDLRADDAARPDQERDFAHASQENIQ